jgi:subfamily B ATP-binding cassette protein MsbA
MSIFALGLLGGITVVMRFVIEPAYTAGSWVAEANELVQQSVQTGTQGIRDVKLFGLAGEVLDRFRESIDQYTSSEIDLMRNKAAYRTSTTSRPRFRCSHSSTSDSPSLDSH